MKELEMITQAKDIKVGDILRGSGIVGPVSAVEVNYLHRRVYATVAGKPNVVIGHIGDPISVMRKAC
jgi:hypothetical protein